MNRKQNGQGLVEFALTLVILIVIVAGMIDAGPLVFNLYAAKQMSARGARAASIYRPDGIRTCYGDAVDAIGNPWLMSAKWSVAVSDNCNGNPFSTIPTGQNVAVQITVDYTPLFWGGFGWPPKDAAGTWPFAVGTVDQA